MHFYVPFGYFLIICTLTLITGIASDMLSFVKFLVNYKNVISDEEGDVTPIVAVPISKVKVSSNMPEKLAPYPTKDYPLCP